ncbi:MAG TPA: glycosyltransferase [Xanthobacteraceae bacterium]|jgi:glycosyltransferase involved in cell wall biosynthesis|nr:glycosyltransferase [Xanthobacteraceae bacterium]
MLSKTTLDALPRGDHAVSTPLPTTVSRRKRICIIGLGSIAHNPRVVKEADALAAAGHEVTVLFLQHFDWARDMDQTILAGAKWRGQAIDVSPSVMGCVRRWTSALQISVFKLISELTMCFPIGELACSRYFPVLLWQALRQRSDLYIGHYTGSLPVVAWAARLTGAKYGFDFEDFHRAEIYPVDPESLETKLVVALEERYLPEASFVTAASWGIGEQVARTTGLPVPTTVLNVFPWADRERLSVPRTRSANAPLSLYWFSQVISLDRGLQDAIEALALMREPAELHIRGNDSRNSTAALQRLAQGRGVADRITFHPILPPGKLLEDAAKHDVGLCLEVPITLNRDICVTNKIFTYMLAELAIAATSTRGQSDVINALPGIGSLYDCGDCHALAAILDRYASDRAYLTRTKAAALSAARERWNWECERKIIVATIEESMNLRRS